MESTLRGLIPNIRLDSRLLGRLIFPYHFKTKRMLLTAKSFRFFEKNAWRLPLKTFTILNEKLNPVEQWKVRYVSLLSILRWDSRLPR